MFAKAPPSSPARFNCEFNEGRALLYFSRPKLPAPLFLRLISVEAIDSRRNYGPVASILAMRRRRPPTMTRAGPEGAARRREAIAEDNVRITQWNVGVV